MDNVIYPAHIKGGRDGLKQEIQSVEEHCTHTAQYARDSVAGVRLGSSAYLAGVLHDMGKFTEKFREYITAAARHEHVVRGSVNHTFAGVRYIYSDLKRQSEGSRDVLISDLLAYAAGAHHGQFDCIGEDGEDGFEHRIQADGIHYEEARDNYLTYCKNAEQLSALYQEAYQELGVVIDLVIASAKELQKELIASGKDPRMAYHNIQFHFGALARLLQSAVIDGDRTDTAEFMGNIRYPDRQRDMRIVWERQLRYVEEKLAQFSHESPINRSRKRISDQCRTAAEDQPGIYALNVPTGAGKTLCSLRFALAHAKHWNQSRILFVTPLLSILEQNAEVIHQFIEDQDLILEHHSNVVQPQEYADCLNQNELLAEAWNAPIIITTLVQLLNTMFSGETSCIRRFHALCNAVIVIDEVQSVPDRLLTMFNQMVQFLCKVCKATVVLCSATQPAFGHADDPITMNIRNMVPYDPAIWEPFRRTNIMEMPSCRLDELPGRVREVAACVGSVLLICNRKDESEQMFRILSEEYKCYHLSAAMCMEHRRRTLEQVKTAIAEKSETPIICVSTQVMEAGVDISFGAVIRLLAGMDSVVQAAGRCNRNHESSQPAPVHIVNCPDEKLGHLEDISRGKDASIQLLYQYQKRPELYQNDLSSDAAVRQYYLHLYNAMPQHYQDYPIRGHRYTGFSLLSSNETLLLLAQEAKHMLQQAFRLAGKNFRIFGDDTLDVIVPYGEGKEIIAELCSEAARYHLPELLQKAKGYTVSLYPYQKKLMEEKHAILRVAPEIDAYFLLEGFYDPDTGVTTGGQMNDYLEV